MQDSTSPLDLYPTDTSATPGNTITAAQYYPQCTNNQRLINTSGSNCYGAGGAQPDPTLIPQDQISRAVSSYTFLAKFFTCTYTTGAYTLNVNTLNTGDTFALPYDLPFAIQDGMSFEFQASNNNAGGDTLAINGLQGALPIMQQTLIPSEFYNPILERSILAGQYVTVIYNSIANAGNPAFILQEPINPAFNTGNTNYTFIPSGAHLFNFNAVTVNNGGSFDPSTDIFLPPAGIYFLTASINLQVISNTALFGTVNFVNANTMSPIFSSQGSNYQYNLTMNQIQQVASISIVAITDGTIPFAVQINNSISTLGAGTFAGFKIV